MPSIFRAPLIRRIGPTTSRVAVHAQPEVSPNLLSTLLAVAEVVNPFFQLDWPNPQRARPTILAEGSSWQDLLSTLLQGEVSPFGQADWPLPLPGRPRVLAEVWPTLLDTLLAIPPSPFIPLEWPNPPRPVAGITEARDNLLLTLLRGDVNPFVVSDWVNPRWPRIGALLDLVPPNLLATVLAVVGRTSNIDAWVMHHRRRRGQKRCP